MDVSHTFGQDISVAANGDILIADGTLEGQQRIIRRLLTNQLDYYWHPQYGAGLPQFVGQPARLNQISAITQSQMYKEQIVQQNPPPVISITDNQNGVVNLVVQYVDSNNATSILTLPLGQN